MEREQLRRCLRQTAGAVIHAVVTTPRSEKTMGSSQYAIATTEVKSSGLSKPRNALKLVVLGATGRRTGSAGFTTGCQSSKAIYWIALNWGRS